MHAHEFWSAPQRRYFQQLSCEFCAQWLMAPLSQDVLQKSDLI
jgi:hypothetical protein